MEKERLIAQAEKAGVRVHWTAAASVKRDLDAFLERRTVCASPDLGIALEKANTAPADAEVGIAAALGWAQETATALVDGLDRASLIPPVSVLVVKAADVVMKFDALIDAVKADPNRRFVFVTGPSRTADIEKVLVIPAHGPKELHLFIVE